MRVSFAFLLLAVVALVSCQSLGDTSGAQSNSNHEGTASTAPSAGKSSSKWIAEKIDTTKGADYLSDVERQVIVEINKARSDPKAYALAYIEPLREYYQGTILQYPGEMGVRTNEGIHALVECIRVLTATKPVGVLSPKKGLTLAARDQAKDQAKTGATGHTGSDHSTLTDRMNRYGKWDLAAGENIDYGNAQARRIVISLLIDDGVVSRGHRKNILDKAFNFIGVAVGPHPTYRSMCVLDFAGAYQ
jgi:uncharacterized protein YkwD